VPPSSPHFAAAQFFGTHGLFSPEHRDAGAVAMLRPVEVGRHFSFHLMPNNVRAPVVWSLADAADNALPEGMELVHGQLRGTPAEEGEFSFLLSNVDAAGAAMQRRFQIRVTPATARIGVSADAYVSWSQHLEKSAGAEGSALTLRLSGASEHGAHLLWFSSREDQDEARQPMLLISEP